MKCIFLHVNMAYIHILIKVDRAQITNLSIRSQCSFVTDSILSKKYGDICYVKLFYLTSVSCHFTGAPLTNDTPTLNEQRAY